MAGRSACGRGRGRPGPCVPCGGYTGRSPGGSSASTCRSAGSLRRRWRKRKTKR
uniref:Uncharacterized protein n=1 Tax=Arundo donax TaxID=35708 RepID=A0A0A8YGF5_ARUDO